nr:MAG TPA: hypothetical protein [Caudoviricetes sp.]DAR33370.1 MAG TPA: hypothetical protein [Ackermannviridae sp.]
MLIIFKPLSNIIYFLAFCVFGYQIYPLHNIYRHKL